MGSQTHFEGRLRLVPPLTSGQAAGVNAPHPLGRTWEVSPNGQELFCSQAEKASVALSELEQLLANLDGCVADGVLTAYGEEPGDQWEVQVKASAVILPDDY